MSERTVSKTPYSLIEALCTVAEFFEVDIVSNWGDNAIIVDHGDDPLTVYRSWKNGGKS